MNCSMCGRETEDFFECGDCGDNVCYGCGDGDMCNLCLGDDIFLADILDLEE